MNLNELFFFKVFPCSQNINQKLNKKPHNQNNCYFYHTSTTNTNDNTSKNIEKDKRREPIPFSSLFKNLFSKIKDEDNYYTISLDTIFEMGGDQKNINYYIDSMPFEYFNEYIYFNNDCCHNETEFNYHMDRYKKNICRFQKINKKCKNKFCYGKHIINGDINIGDNKENNCINIIINNINNINNNENDIDEGIIKFRKIINVWKDKKEIKFKEIIDLYNYILTFENKYLSNTQLNEINQYFNIFLKWYNDIKDKAKPILRNNHKSINSNENSENSYDNEEKNNKSYNEENDNYINNKILKKYFHEQENDYKTNRLIKLSDNPLKIYKNSNLLETLKINTNVCYMSKYTIIKKAEIVKYVYAMLNSSDGVIIYGGHENNNIIKGISLNRKERDKFKIWFNSEFIKILIKYEDNLKYNFYDLSNNINDECVLVIEIKKIKSHKFLIKFPAKCLIIKEKFLNRNKNEKNKLLNEENVKELDLREYLEILRKKLLEHYSEKFKVKIN